jgi:diaminopimelate decarboxylase
MAAYAKEIGAVCQALGGFQPQEVDIGGGFAVPRDPFNADTAYREPFRLAALYAIAAGLRVLGTNRRYGFLRRLVNSQVKKPKQRRAPSIEEYAEVCTSTLKQHLPKHGITTKDLTLQIEPGRAIHGDAGVHLATVNNIKRLRRPIAWNVVVVDTTEFWFAGGRLEHHLHDYVFANKTDAGFVDKADIVGCSCYADRLMPSVPVPKVEVGDTLALLDTGAYQEVSASNFNALPRPATVLVKDDQASLIRRRESEADVFQRDVIPEHLRRRTRQDIKQH